MKQRICVIIRSLEKGGAEKQSILLVKALQAKHDVVYVILSKFPQHFRHLERIREAGIRPIFLEGNIVKKAQTFRSLLREHQIETIFSFLPSDTFFAGFLGKITNVKSVFGGLRNAKIPSKLKLWAMRFVHNRILNYSISNSYQGREYLIEHGFNPAKILVIHNAMDHFPEAIHHRTFSPIQLITVGRFVPQKGFDTALKAIKLLADQYGLREQIKYIIVGEGEMEYQIQSWIQDFGLEGIVELLIDPPDLLERYKSSDIYLCSSLFEGLSNTVMEALSYSLPVVATDAGDNRELVLDGENGFITKIGDFEEIAKRLAQLIGNPEMRQQFGERGYAHITANFSFNAFKEKYTQILEKDPVKVLSRG